MTTVRLQTSEDLAKMSRDHAPHEEFKAQRSPVQVPKLQSATLPPLNSPPQTSPSVPSKPQSDRFTSLKYCPSPDNVLEEEFENQADGLLKWIEELPDELSGSSAFVSKVVL
jgi:hypothetical protein